MKARSWFAAALLALLVACGQHGLEGKWRLLIADANTIWEFTRGGSVTIGDQRGKYTLGNDDRIKIETGIATSVYQLQLSGDTLTLRDMRGAKMEFARIK